MDYKRKEILLIKKKGVMAFLMLLCCMFCGCSGKKNAEPVAWIPDNDSREELQTTSEETDIEKISAQPVYSSKELAESLQQDPGRNLADMLWENQKVSGVYEYNSEQLERGKLLVYYISSSEGDDTNDGLSPQTPKKSLEQFSGSSNLNILLKCGDTFHMTKSFAVGNNVTLATYGEGARPVLDYYQPLEVKWKKSDTYENVWYADLKEISTLCNDTKDRRNCNIGQLQIDGECNWKRKVKTDEEDFSYGEYLSEASDGSWGIDWVNSVLYLYADSDPSNRKVSYAPPVHGLEMNSIRNSQIFGVEITGAGFHGISLMNVNNVKVQSCYIHHIGGAFLQGVRSRHGNAVELWESGQDVTVSYNVADWIFDTCYTNQGNSASTVEKNVVFSYNVGRYSFWGIETWGDSYADLGFENISYQGNIIMNACDVTAPKEVAFCNQEEKLIDETGNLSGKWIPYVSYREGYTYHQMSLLSASDIRQEGQLVLEDNVFWGTNRFLCLFGKLDEGRGFPIPENNLFFGMVPSEEVCLFRYTDPDGTRHFLQQLPLGQEKNTLIVCGAEDQEKLNTAQSVLEKSVEIIANGMKQE